jgi:hypothetical protein
MQDSLHLDLSKEPFVSANTQKPNIDDFDREPRPSYMSDVLAAFAARSPVPRSDAALVSSKRRYGELTGLSKEIAQRVSGDPQEFERIKAVLTTTLAGLRKDEEIQNPGHVKGKGRPRNKRLRSAVESKGPSRCGRCGEEGHNARTCKA